MRRDASDLQHGAFDLVVVGGGIHGAAAAWDAAQRGLRVALLEKDDWGSHTSFNSLKIIHGGLRYLQHGNLRRVRTAIRERRAWLRMAPRLVRPLPCLMPAGGRLLRGRSALRAALAVYDLLGLDRNRDVPADRTIPSGRLVSREECDRLLPVLDGACPAGAALWYDAFAENTERLLIALVRSAVDAGARAANYCRAERLLVDHGGAVAGVFARDGETGEGFEVRAPAVVEACGPWSGTLAGTPPGRGDLVAALNVLVDPIPADRAFGLQGGAGRLFFFVPWRGGTMIGTAYRAHDASPDGYAPSAAEVEAFLEEAGRVLPSARLESATVRFVHAGLLPAGSDDGPGGPQPALRDRVVDHGARSGARGHWGLFGAKYTTARVAARRVIDRVVRAGGHRGAPCRTDRTLLRGAGGPAPEELARRIRERTGADPEGALRLARTYGPDWEELLGDLPPGNRPEPVDLVVAQTRHAIRVEMARRLPDILFRRTDLASAGDPGEEVLASCARAAADRLDWGPERVEEELAAVRARLALGRPPALGRAGA